MNCKHFIDHKKILRYGQISGSCIMLLLFFGWTAQAGTAYHSGANKKKGHPFFKYSQQNKTISGRVTDTDGNPLEGASITAKGTSAGTVTNSDGRYTLNIPDGTQALVISFSGFASKEVLLNGRDVVNAELEPTSGQLQNVVVVGYGTRDRRALTSSVATIQNKNIKDIKATSFEQLMVGQLPGVLVQQSTGHPGAGLNIKIRGTGSISALNDPLYVIDGMPIESPGFNNRINVLSFLNPQDIESITVLKDAASTSIYGSRGSNGVVLITTKTAKQGKTTLEANAFYGVQQIPERGRLKMMNAEEFANFRIEALQDAAALRGTPFDPGTIPSGYQNVKGPGTNWLDVVTRDNAPIQNYNLTLRTGTDKIRAMVSLDYLSQDGNVMRTKYQRGSLRINLDADISNRLKYGVRINPSYSFRDLGGEVEGFPTGSTMGFALAASPISPVYLPDGSLNPVVGTGPDNFLFPNPINRFNGVTDLRNDLRLLASNFLEVGILKGLTYKTNIGTDLSLSQSRYFYPSYVGAGFSGPGGSTTIPLGQAFGSAGRDQFTTWLIENYFTYRNKFAKDHSFEVLAGHTAQKQEYDVISVSGSRFPDDKIPYVVAALPGDFRDGTQGSDNFRYSIESYYGRLNYDYRGKYFLNGTIRRDGTSRFSPAARWGTFPSASAGWLVSAEPFMQNLPFISELKLRGSYGITGNNNIRSSFAYVPGLGTNSYVFGNSQVQGTVVGFADQGLKWESNKETDIGLDVSLFNNRISATVDWYVRKTYNLLLGRPIPSITGAGSIQTNIGSIQNKGVEFSINSTNLRHKNILWETGFNLSINRNKVLELNDNNDPIESGDPFQGSTITQVGSPLGLFKGYIIEGIYQTEAEALADSMHNRGARAGTLRIRDVNNDGAITPADRTVIGNPWAKFTWGFNTRLVYNNIDFSMQVTGSVGNEVLLSVYEFAHNMDGPFNVVADIKYRWRSPRDPGRGVFPTTNHPSQLQYIRLANNTWVKNGSYARISNITAGYTFPARWLNVAKMVKGLRLYSTVQNAFIFSKTPLNNPEASLQNGTLNMGWQRNTYPLARQVTFGANVTF